MIRKRIAVAGTAHAEGCDVPTEIDIAITAQSYAKMLEISRALARISPHSTAQFSLGSFVAYDNIDEVMQPGWRQGVLVARLSGLQLAPGYYPVSVGCRDHDDDMLLGDLELTDEDIATLRSELPSGLKSIVERAQDAFWDTIAAAHPEITSGDFSPTDTLAFDGACMSATAAWLDANRPEAIDGADDSPLVSAAPHA